MGIHTEALLVYGWRVDRGKMLRWLSKRGAGSCQSDDQCFCGPSCWTSGREGDKRVKIDPFGCVFDYMMEYPYYDCRDEDVGYHVSIPLDGRDLASIRSVPKATVKKIRRLAVEWGADDCDARMYAIVRVS